MSQNWHLESFKLEFVRGWKHEGTVDRYEAKVEFKDGTMQAFTINLTEGASAKILALIGEELATTATEFAESLKNSLPGGPK